jgi:hypothetical protein
MRIGKAVHIPPKLSPTSSSWPLKPIIFRPMSFLPIPILFASLLTLFPSVQPSGSADRLRPILPAARKNDAPHFAGYRRNPSNFAIRPFAPPPAQPAAAVVGIAFRGGGLFSADFVLAPEKGRGSTLQCSRWLPRVLAAATKRQLPPLTRLLSRMSKIQANSKSPINERRPSDFLDSNNFIAIAIANNSQGPCPNRTRMKRPQGLAPKGTVRPNCECTPSGFSLSCP